MTHPILNCGYVPLVDCAPLIIAKELGFAEDEGLKLNLLRQPSWSALRDLLALGHLDAAHMLSPMPLAMRLGLSGQTTEVDAPLVLSTNGTVVGVSTDLAAKMRASGWIPDIGKPKAFTDTLSKATDRPLRVGVPFPFSMHRLLFEYLVADLDAATAPSFEIVPTPPPLMSQAVADGEIDIFCVGEPWGSVAVTSGVAELIMPGAAIWASAPEKVLGLRRDWIEANDALCGALIRSIYRAAKWLGQTENGPLASEILARSEHLDLSDQLIDPALTGRLVMRSGRAPMQIDGFLKFHAGASTFPWRSLGAWIGQQISELHGLDRERTMIEGSNCWRSDLYRRHLASSHVDMPGASAKIEGAMVHRTAVASTRGQMILGPDAFFDSKTFEFPELN